MSQPIRPGLAVALALGAGLMAPTPAWAAADGCAAPRVNVMVPPGVEWATATADLTEHLRALPDLDKCARVSVRPNGASVIVDITTGDGRQATRRADSESELLRTVEALLVLPPEPAAVAPRPSPLELPPREAPAPRSPVRATHVELGGGGSFRIGGGPAYVGGGVAGFAQFALDDWLLAVSGRWELADAFVNQPTPSDFNMESSAVGVSVGHRLEHGNFALDTLVGPSIVLESEDADDGNREIHGASADFRLSVSVRVSGPRSSSLRAFVTGDFEGSPARLRSQKFIDHSLPQLPWWGSGIALGVLWGAR